MHWAANYIGRPWGPIGSGLSCWEFVRHVLTTHYGHAVPEMPVEALETSGWQRIETTFGGCVPAACRDGDVLLLRGTELHCGVIVHEGTQLGLLHADGAMHGCQARGNVVWAPLALALEGYRRAELWSHDAR